MLQQVGGYLRMVGIQADADGGRHRQLQAFAKVQRLHEGGDELLGDVLGLLHRGDVFEHHGELIPAQSRHGVLCAHGLLHARGGGAQDAVASGVAQGIVDVLETVQVDEQHGHASVLASRPHDGA